MKFQTDTVVKIVRTSLLVTAWFCLVRSSFVKSFSVQFRRITTVWLSASGHAREFNFCDDSGSARATGYNCRQIVVRNGVRSHRDLFQSVSLGNIWQVNHLRALNIENYSSTIIILNVMAWWHYTLWQVLCCTCEDFLRIFQVSEPRRSLLQPSPRSVRFAVRNQACHPSHLDLCLRGTSWEHSSCSLVTRSPHTYSSFLHVFLWWRIWQLQRINFKTF